MTVSQLSDIVLTIIIMSLSGSALILLLFALKPLIRHRLLKSVQYFLWLVTLVALLVPISKLIAIPEAPSDIILAPIHTVVEQNNVIVEEANTFPHTDTSTDPRTDTAARPAVKPALNPILTATTVFTTAYLLMVLVVLSFNIFSYICFTKRVRRRRTRARMEELYEHVGLCGDAIAPRLYRSALATTPMLIGIFKPEVILPDREYTDAQLQSILQHELTHLRRRDVAVKWLSVVACAIHWFNPLVWLARREIDRACELSCDEAVIRDLDQEGKQSYGDTLISVAAETKAPWAVLSTTMCEGKEALKERLDAIMKYQKRTWITPVFSTAIVIMAVCTVCVLGAGAAAPSAPGDYKADALEAASMQSVPPSAAPAATPDPAYLTLLRQNAIDVNTDKEFADALKTAYVITLKKDIILSDEYISLSNINALVIDEGVTLTVTSPNFYPECPIVNLGEILVDGNGRMLFYHEPDYSCIGKVIIKGRDAEIGFNAGKIDADEIAYFLREGSLYNALNIVASASDGKPVEILIDHDIVIPAGKALWINIESVLHVPEGVTITNNGTIRYNRRPIIEGKIDGIGKVFYDF